MKRFSHIRSGGLWRDGRRRLGKAILCARDVLARMSPVQLLVACVMLALAITVLPLALGLFIALLLIKLLISLILIRTARPPRLLPRPGPHDSEPS